MTTSDQHASDSSLTTRPTHGDGPGAQPSLGSSAGRPAGYRRHIAQTVQGLLGLYLLICLAELALYLWSVTTLRGWAERPGTYDLGTAETLDGWTLAAAFTDIAMILLIGVSFIVWLYSTHRSDRMYRPALRHRSGWAIGGWFVPVLNLWRPLQMVNDVRRGALGHDPATGSGLVATWWGVLLASSFASRASLALMPAEDATFVAAMDGLADVAVADSVLAATDALACVLAIAVVRHVSGLLATPAPTR